MEIRSSLRKKSILALTLYLCFFIATIGSVAYLVVEPPVRQKLEQNLELRTQLLALEIKEPLLSSTGVLSSLVGLAQGTENIQSLNTIIPHILQLSDKMLVSVVYGLNPNSKQNNGDIKVYSSIKTVIVVLTKFTPTITPNLAVMIMNPGMSLPPMLR